MSGVCIFVEKPGSTDVTFVRFISLVDINVIYQTLCKADHIVCNARYSCPYPTVPREDRNQCPQEGVSEKICNLSLRFGK